MNCVHCWCRCCDPLFSGRSVPLFFFSVCFIIIAATNKTFPCTVSNSTMRKWDRTRKAAAVWRPHVSANPNYAEGGAAVVLLLKNSSPTHVPASPRFFSLFLIASTILLRWYLHFNWLVRVFFSPGGKKNLFDSVS